jgi:DNA-binding transcriptional regulator YhcF (GntR family)
MTSKWDVLNAVYADPHLSVYARVVAGALINRMNADGTLDERFTPSQDDLASMGNIDVRTVRKALAELEDGGFFQVRRPSAAERVMRKKNRYTATLPSSRKASPTSAKRAAKRAATVVAAEAHAASAPAPEAPVSQGPQGVAGGASTGSPEATLKESHKNHNTPPPPAADGPAAGAPVRVARLRREEGDQEITNPSAVDAVLSQVDFGTEHVGRWSRARMRKRVATALADGWTPKALVHEMTRDLTTARSRVSVVTARLGALGEPPRATPTPPAYVAPTAPQIAPERVSGWVAQARAALAAARPAPVPIM